MASTSCAQAVKWGQGVPVAAHLPGRGETQKAPRRQAEAAAPPRLRFGHVTGALGLPPLNRLLWRT